MGFTTCNDFKSFTDSDGCVITFNSIERNGNRWLLILAESARDEDLSSVRVDLSRSQAKELAEWLLSEFVGPQSDD